MNIKDDNDYDEEETRNLCVDIAKVYQQSEVDV